MTTTLPRALLEQALGERDRFQAELAARRAALAQQAEPVGTRALIEECRAALAEPTGKESLQVESVVAENATTQQQIEDTPPSDYRRGYWDGFAIGKREGRIEAEDAAKQAEPVQQVIRCKDKRENNGVCPHHNLQCGWPKCNE